MNRPRLIRLIGADRERIIAVLATTREAALRGVTHARTAAAGLPIHVWCAEPGPPPADCAAWHSPFSRAALRGYWPALTIVMWDVGYQHAALKLTPFTVPPFRVVIGNEAGGYFPPGPLHLARHFSRRSRDRSLWIARRLRDWISGVPQGLWSLTYRAAERLRDLAMLGVSGLLIVLSLLAHLVSPLVRLIVRRWPGRPAEPLSFPASPDLTCTEITLPVRLWPRRAILRAVQQSTAGFVAFRERAETAPVNPLIAAAISTGAFAVARQRAWSGWRKRVATKHPFRRLQPGELTECEAPHGPLIVMRREVLLQLGIPRALTTGSALLEIFRRAGSRDLRSLVIGHGGFVSDEPAMPLEDAEFALRLCASPQLRALGVTRPELRRGAIAWCGPESAPHNARPRVQIVSPYLPFPLSHGGAVRIFNLCKALADRVDFHLVCFREANERVEYEELHRVFRTVRVVDIDEISPATDVPKQIAGYRSIAMAALIGRDCDLVQLEFTQMAEYRGYARGRPTILVEHDVTYTLYRQMTAADAKQQYPLWLQFERAALREVSSVWAMSDADRALIAQDTQHIRLVPNGVDLERFQPLPDSPAPVVLFIGSFRHLPNLLAFEALLTQLMPEVWKVVPEARLHVIAGPAHEKAAALARKAALLAPDPRVRISGFVSDVRPAYAESTVVVTPIPISAGTNIKVLEAMACARAVVSNAVGSQGLGLDDAHDLLIREIGPDFAAAIIQLLRDSALRIKLGAQARRTVELRYGWNAIAQEALRSYAELTVAAPSADQPQIPR